MATYYPLTLAQVNLLHSIHVLDNEDLGHKLKSVRDRCVEDCKLGTDKCPQHSKEIRSLWRDYYTILRPGRWIGLRSPDFLTDVRRMFDSRKDIHTIHARVARELRDHRKDVYCTIRLDDLPAVKEYKDHARAMFESGVDETKIVDFIKSQEHEVQAKRTPKELAEQARFDACQSEQEKYNFYRDLACTLHPSDTPADRRIQEKLANLFDAGVAYPDIRIAWLKEVEELERTKIELESKLVELTMAKSGHDKAKLAKDEEKRAREAAKQRPVPCSGLLKNNIDHCPNICLPEKDSQFDLSCLVCERQYKEGKRQQLYVFCSEDCWNQSKVMHVINEHPCTTGAMSCIRGVTSLEPSNLTHGPDCVDCWDDDNVLSQWCSVECLEKNAEKHESEVHERLIVEKALEISKNEESFMAWLNLTGYSLRDIELEQAHQARH